MAGKRRPEAKIQEALTEYLRCRKWLVESTHGNAYQQGLPDLFIASVRHGCRWIDCKVKGRYSFTKAQRHKWPEWERHGVGIWILTAATDDEYAKLFQPPNWRDYWRPSYGQLTDIDALLQELNDEHNAKDQ